MNNARRFALTLAPVAAALALTPASLAQDFIVPANTSVVFDTDTQPTSQFGRFEVQAGGVLRVTGSRPFAVTASHVVIDGLVDASGVDSIGVTTLNTATQPEIGADGAAGGGRGGTGSFLSNQSTAVGGDGFGAYTLGSGVPAGGGGGGESSFAPSVPFTASRRAAGGGGGALALDQPVASFPLDPANLGLVATEGFNGSMDATGAVNMVIEAQGGSTGQPLFVDMDPSNDFWGEKPAPAGTVRGEALRPEPGRGGGGGGDATSSAVFPNPAFSPLSDEKGAGGGGGGGLVVFRSRTFAIGPDGRIVADGGDGGGGENVFFFDRIGGGSGGGSGGWLVVDALLIDLRQASEDAFTALGGRGGVGANNQHDVEGAGGNGGPGVIQFSTRSGLEAEILRAPGIQLGDLCSPRPHVVLPVLNR